MLQIFVKLKLSSKELANSCKKRRLKLDSLKSKVLINKNVNIPESDVSVTSDDITRIICTRLNCLWKIDAKELRQKTHSIKLRFDYDHRHRSLWVFSAQTISEIGPKVHERKEGLWLETQQDTPQEFPFIYFFLKVGEAIEKHNFQWIDRKVWLRYDARHFSHQNVLHHHRPIIPPRIGYCYHI